MTAEKTTQAGDGRGTYAVTGAAGGIGLAVVQQLLAAGHRVVLLDQSPDLATIAKKLDPDRTS